MSLQASRVWWKQPEFLVGTAVALVSLSIGALLALPVFQDWVRRSFLHETEQRTGRLLPESSRPAQSICGTKQGEVAVDLGGMGMLVSVKDRLFPVMRVNETLLLELMVTSDGFLDVYASVYNQRGQKAVEIKGGFGWAVNENLAVRVRAKKSELEVSEDGKLLLRVTRTSPTTAQVEGTFHFPGGEGHYDVEGATMRQGGFAFGNVCVKNAAGMTVWTRARPRPPYRSRALLEIPPWETARETRRRAFP